MILPTRHRRVLLVCGVLIGVLDVYLFHRQFDVWFNGVSFGCALYGLVYLQFTDPNRK